MVKSCRQCWRVMGASVRGASHIRNNKPNQDAVTWFSGPDSGLPVIMAVSDGHGSSKCFRSRKGADFAVNIAVNTVKEFIESHTGIQNFTAVKRIADEFLPRKIVRTWKSAVESDMANHPFSMEEAEILQENYPALAYGATLIILLVTNSFIIYWQLGDGDIITLWEGGRVERPVPSDARLFANETTSLCSENAWQNFRFYFQPVHDRCPRLILLASDGYANSFRDEESFLKVAPDLWHMIKSKGHEYVESHLKQWLNQASEEGSGDDITVAVVVSETVNSEQ